MGNQGDEWGDYDETQDDAVIVKANGGDGEFFVCADEERSQYWSPNPRIHLSRLSVTLPASVSNDSKYWHVRGEICENGERWYWENPNREGVFPVIFEIIETTRTAVRNSITIVRTMFLMILRTRNLSFFFSVCIFT